MPAPVARPTRIIRAGNLGATYTLPLRSDDRDVLVIATLTASCVIIPTGMTPGISVTLLLTQDATGSRAVTFSPTAKTVGGTALGMSTAASAVDVVTIFSPDGSKVFALLAGKGMA